MNNDLISRSALIKWIDDSVSQYGNTYSTDMLNMWGLFKDYLINNAPTVEPSLNLDNITDEEIEKFKIVWQRANSKGLLTISEERPQGEWIEVEDTETKINGYCSNCGWESKLYEEDILGMPFCPNCGAKMKGGAE